MASRARARAAAAEAPSLLDTLARAPAAAALVVAALDRLEDRKALRLAHSELRDAVGEATTWAAVFVRRGAAPARPPTPARWPRLAVLMLADPDLAALEALGSGTWRALRELRLGFPREARDLGAPCARALAAALRRAPALELLELHQVRLPPATAAALFEACAPRPGGARTPAPTAQAAPRLRALTLTDAALTPAAARALGAAGWRLEELRVEETDEETAKPRPPTLGAAGAAALAAAPACAAIRRLTLVNCGVDEAALLAIARAPWPLEELDLSHNDLGDLDDVGGGPAAVAALAARHGARLRRLDLGGCFLSAAAFKALVEADWPALAHLDAAAAEVDVDLFGADQLEATTAFAGFPALEALNLLGVELRLAGVFLLASRRWARLQTLTLSHAQLGAVDVAMLARGAWPALEVLDLRQNGLLEPLALEGVRRWAPALVELLQ